MFRVRNAGSDQGGKETMPGIGGLSIATNLLANSVSLNLNRNQAALQNVVTQLSSGLRINSAADDPSGLAIATRLNAQSQGTDVGSQNVQDANNAATIAGGALQTETSILQRIRNLAVEASNDLTSDSDKLSLQSEVQQLLLEVNRISQNTNFNNQPLLNGSHEGFTPQQNFNATIYSNAVLSASGANPGTTNFLVQTAGFSITNNASVDGTLQLQVAQLSATQQGIIFSFLTTSTTGVVQNVCIATISSAGTAVIFSYDGVTVTSGINIGTADVGVTSYIKITQFVSSATNPSNPAFSIQDGPSEGAVITFGIQATNTQTLRISNINLAGSIGTVPSLAAEDAIGQVDFALNQILSQSALIGAVVNRLNQDLDNNNIASVNLTAAASNITDLNIAQATSQYTKLNILVQVGTSVLAQSNVNAQSVLGLFR
jgi:flagellin